MFYTLLLVGIFLLILYRLIKFLIVDPWSIHRDLWNQGIPGEYIPIVGELLYRRRAILDDDPYSYTQKMSNKYGDYYHTSFGPRPCLNISDPSLIEGVLKTNARSYHKSALGKLIIGSMLGYENLIVTDDEKHNRHRRLIAPVFQHQNINSMISLMIERTSTFLAKWKTAITDNKDHLLTLDIHEEMTNLTLDIVTGCVFGTEIVGDQHVHKTIGKCITTAMKATEKRMLNMIAIVPLLNQLPLSSKQCIDQSRRDIKRIIRNIINQRKRGLTKSACKGFIIILVFKIHFSQILGPDLLDLLLAAHADDINKFTDEEVSDEAVTFGKYFVTLL
jgi:cytochrome P450